MKFFLQLGQFSLYLAQEGGMKKIITLALCLLPMSFVIAQEQEQDTANDSETYLEEVTVTGIKSSLINAIDIKRSNVGVM